MTVYLASPFFQFMLHRDAGTWSLFGSQKNSPFIENAGMQVKYRHKRYKYEALQSWRGAEISAPRRVFSRQGNSQVLSVSLGPDSNSLFYTIEFSLPESYPLFLWRLTIQNQGERSFEIEQIQMMKAGFLPKPKFGRSNGIWSDKNQKSPNQEGVIRPYPDPGDLAFFSNGWQSWSFTGTLGSSETTKDTRLGNFAAPMWFNHGTPRPSKPGHFSSDMFGVLGDRIHRTGILAGFLSQLQHFGSLEASTDPLYPALVLWANGDCAILKPGTGMRTDWAVIQFVDINNPDPLADYIQGVAREHNLDPSNFDCQPTIGWSSWYQFFQDISEEKVRANLESASNNKTRLPVNLFEIDDGFEAQIGDWFDFSSDFPHGLAPLAQEIKKTGITPGLWLAPFIVHSRSQLKHTHPDWLLRDQRGRPINAGFVWNNFNKALDLTHPEALNYAKQVVSTAVHEWGYQFLKLDFLYAAAIKGCFRDRTKTRAQVLRMGLEALREVAGPEVHLLGCGAPLGSSIGIFDSMRIGADVDPNWNPSILGIKNLFRNEHPMPSTRNAIQNILTRAMLHRRWWINDPDCLLVRPNSELTLPEVRSLATAIAISGGPLMLSDDLPQLPKERRKIAEQLVPLIDQRPSVLDWFDKNPPSIARLDLENTAGKWYLVAIFNWDDVKRVVDLSPEKFGLPAGKYFAHEFWSGVSTQIENDYFSNVEIAAHGVGLFALRSNQNEQACYLGSDLHISQGMELIDWSLESSKISLHLKRPSKTQGFIDLYLPHTPLTVKVNQINTRWQSIEKNMYRLPLHFEREAIIEIN